MLPWPLIANTANEAPARWSQQRAGWHKRRVRQHRLYRATASLIEGHADAGADGTGRSHGPELPRLAVRRDRGPDQALWIPAYHAQSGGKLPRPARFPGQLRRQRAADDAVPARRDRGADRPRLCQGDRQADGGDPAQSGRSAACLHGDLLRLHRPRADLHHRRHRPDGRGQAPAAYRLDALGARAGQRRARLREVGLPADLDRRRAGKLRPRLFDHDHGAARPGLHVLRRRPAGGAAYARRAAASRRRHRDPGPDGAGSRRRSRRSRTS